MIVKSKAVYDNVLNIPERASGEFWIEHVTHPTGYVFHTTNARTKIIGRHQDAAISYDHQTTWHRLRQDTSVWMSDYPIEQAQADRELKPMRSGRVLVGGLGLGYAATMLALRPNIREVVVVERAQDVIDLVAEHTCARDATARAKLTFVHDDLFHYLRALPDRRVFDHAFYDIWASDSERILFGIVLPLLKLSERRVRFEPVCWNESVMRGQLLLSLDSRWNMVRAIEAHIWEKHPGMLTLDELCEANGTIWRDWTVPFFRWARRVRPTEALFNERATLYAARYGRRGFRALWNAVTGEDVPDLPTTTEEDTQS